MSSLDPAGDATGDATGDANSEQESDAEHGSDTADPVLERRQRIEKLARVVQRVGYALFAVAIAAFFASLATGSPPVLIRIATWSLVLACVVLGPAMVAHYTVKAADRADREDDWR